MASIPNGWDKTRLQEVVEVHDSQRVPVNAKERAHRLDGATERFPYYGATGQVGEIDDFIFEGEAILLGEDGAPFLDRAKRKAYLVDGRYWVNNHAHVLRGCRGMVNSFLCHQLNFVDYQPYVSGTTRLKLNQASMKEIDVLVCGEDEQQLISSKIDELFSHIEAGQGALARARALLEPYQRAVLRAAVTGELTKAWRLNRRSEHETGQQLVADILNARRDAWDREETAAALTGQSDKKGKRRPVRYKEPRDPDKANTPNLPNGWTLATLEQLCFIDTGATPKRGESKYYEDGKIAWVTSGAVNAALITEATEWITEKAISETNAKVFPIGTLLIAMYGEGKTRGKVSELGIEAATNQACAALRCGHLDARVKDYLRIYLEKCYHSLRASAAGGVQPNLNLTILKNLVVPLPSLAEIEAIVDAVETRLRLTETVAAEFDGWKAEAIALRQSILKAAFSGELVGRSEDDARSLLGSDYGNHHQASRERGG